MPQSHLDPIAVAITVTSLVLGPAVAAVLGPYAVIFLASTVGASWALGRRAPDAKLGAVWYFLRINATAMLITVSCATAATRWLGVEDGQWLLTLIALFVGGVGDDWPRVGRWAITRAGRLIERRASGGN